MRSTTDTDAVEGGRERGRGDAAQASTKRPDAPISDADTAREKSAAGGDGDPGNGDATRESISKLAISLAAVSAASASACALAINAMVYAGRGCGREGAGPSLSAAGGDGDRGNGDATRESVSKLAISLAAVSAASASACALAINAMVYAGRGCGRERAGPELSLRLRRGGVPAGATSAVRAADDGSFVTSTRGTRGGGDLMNWLTVCSATLAEEQEEIGLSRDARRDTESPSLAPGSSSGSLSPASISMRPSKKEVFMALVAGAVWFRVRESLTSEAVDYFRLKSIKCIWNI